METDTLSQQHIYWLPGMATGHFHDGPYDSGLLPVGDIHKLHYEQYGKKDGKPVIFLHGGPGGGTSKENTRFFDPAIYRVILLDQRGAGRSTPVAETRENTSQHLVADIETLREHLNVAKWHMVFGGSWGSTLALLYAQTHPAAVGSLVLRGIFCGRKLETDYVNGPNGAAMLFPEEYEKYTNYLAEEDRSDPFAGYLKLLSSPDAEVRCAAGKVYNSYEMQLSKVQPKPEDFDKLEDDDYSLAHGLLELHYFKNHCFLEQGELLRQENLDKIKHIPCSIVQGRLDFVCPPRTAWDLHKHLPDSKLYMIPLSGHSAMEPGNFKKLVEICDEYAQLQLV